jgi:hypothetical protein
MCVERAGRRLRTIALVLSGMVVAVLPGLQLEDRDGVSVGCAASHP